MPGLVMPALSVLDLVPVSTGQTSAQALSAAMALVQRADDLGFTRYWFAEHHNTLAGASSTPAVTIAAALAHSRSIRLGAGGVMLPNHPPLIVAEQFAALEAIAPGRIDLGLGRAPGSDPVITQMLRMSGPTGDASKFPEHVSKIVGMLAPGGARFRISPTAEYDLHVTAHATTAPTVWVLGSSAQSAVLAADLGLPYVFATHFGSMDAALALDRYRSSYRPSEAHPTPYAFITANVVAAPTRAEAEARALPQLRLIAGMQLRRPSGPMDTVEQAVDALTLSSSAMERQIIDRMRATWFGGTGEEVAQQLVDLARTFEVDEIMLHPIAGRYAEEAPDESPGRIQTIELIADAVHEHRLSGSA